MNLREAGVGKQRALAMRAPSGRDIGRATRCAEAEGVRVTACGEHHRVGHDRRDLPADKVAHDNPFGVTVDDDQFQHLLARKHLDRAEADLMRQGLIRAEQQLLSRLATRVERPRHLRATERSRRQITAVFTRKRHTLRHRLVNHVHADFRQTIDVCLARAEVAALQGVVEQPIGVVTVIAIVLGGIDPALRRDAVRPPRAVLNTERFDVVTQLRQRGRSRRASQAGAYNDDVVFPFVGGTDEAHFMFVTGPLFHQRPGRDVGIEFHVTSALPSTRPTERRQTPEAAGTPPQSKSCQCGWPRSPFANRVILPLPAHRG